MSRDIAEKQISIVDRTTLLSIIEILTMPTLDIYSQHTAIKELMHLWAVNLKRNMNEGKPCQET